MSNYINKDDYAESVRNNILDQITNVDDGKLDIAENRSIDEMKSYLAVRFDVETIFARTGASRNQILVMFCCDITLYHLHCLLNPRKIPEHRIERYKAAIDWLKNAANASISPVNMPLLNTGTSGEQSSGSRVLYGSNKRRDNQY